MTARIHPTAIIEANVTLGAGTAVWDNVHIRRDTTLGDECIVGEKTYIAYGVTIGHLMEWARLALHVGTALRRTGTDAPAWLLEDAQALFERAVADGWQETGDGHTEEHGPVKVHQVAEAPLVAWAAEKTKGVGLGG